MIDNVEYFSDFDVLYKKYAQYSGTLVLLVAEKTPYKQELINEFQGDLFGAIFPQVLFGENHYETGIVLLMPQKENKTVVIRDLKNPNFDHINDDTKSLIVFFDGLSNDISPFIEELFIHSDESLRMMGGGAGKMSLKQEPVIFDKGGIYKNAALVMCIAQNMGIAANHGYKKLQGPFIATLSDGNTLKQINYKNAFEFYSDLLEDQGELTHENFYDIAKEYPFGIETLDNETIVRDPIGFDESGIQLVGTIESNSVISLLHGDKEALIEAACKAVQEAIYRVRYIPTTLFVIDCISRSLFLQEEFDQELKAIHSFAPYSQMYGALTIGEVANSTERYIEFFNKTCVVGAI